MDETIYNLLKKRGYLWNASSRKKDVAQVILGEDFSGIIITDRYVGYDWISTAQRQLCWAHLIRDFKLMAESKHAASRLVSESLLKYSNIIFENWTVSKRGR